jgi:hypothetical protein
MRLLCAFMVLLAGLSGCVKQTTKVSYPDKFEGLTQLILASETKTLSFTDTTVSKILGFKIASAQARVTSNVSFDFYLDFEQDGYSMQFNATGDTLLFKAPILRVKKPIINNTQVSYPEKNFLINAEAQAVKKLETLTDEFIKDGEALLKEEYVRAKCDEMLRNFLQDMCAKLHYSVQCIIIEFQVPAS